jgi:hypothetical protein
VVVRGAEVADGCAVGYEQRSGRGCMCCIGLSGLFFVSVTFSSSKHLKFSSNFMYCLSSQLECYLCKWSLLIPTLLVHTLY